MSWKLAELRWRHDVGLNEKCREMEQEAPVDDREITLRGSGHLQRQYGRSYPGPWCRVVEQSELPENTLRNAIRSHPTLLASPSGPSASSAAPLLKRTRSGVNEIADSYSPRPISEQDIKESALSLSHLRTPTKPTSFPRGAPCPQFDGIQGIFLPQEDCPVSSKVTTPSLAFSAKSREGKAVQLPWTPQRPFSDASLASTLSVWSEIANLGFQSASEARSPFQFDFPRTPSFGLHLAQHSRLHQERDAHNLTRVDPGPWTQSQSFSATFRRNSVESTHHSDSALLQNISMDIQSCYSSPDRRATRPLYPDLPSAYADIQGRRTASLQQVSSSRSATRFPLSPSSSSSDEEAPVAISLGNDDVPLRTLPCRNVRSAHIVLHEADHHPESSAIFETSDENTDPSRGRNRASTTLEDIVSQYADARMPNSRSLGDIEEHRGIQRPVLGHGEVLEVREDPFRAEPVRSSTSDSSHELYRLYEQRAEDNTIPARADCDAVGYDEEWEMVPESSRTGFFTPSKMRFRLRKRNTVETSTSGVTGRSPTSPWDPLSNLTQTKQAKPHPQLHHKDHPHYSRTQPLSDELRYRDDSATDQRSSTRQPWSTDARKQKQDTEGQRGQSRTARAHVPRPVHILNERPQPEKRTTLTQLNSSSHPERSTAFSSTHALASSSLLPRTLDNKFVSSSSTLPAMETSPESPPVEAGNPTFRISSLVEEDSNTISDENFGSAVVNPASSFVHKAQNPVRRFVEDASPAAHLGAHNLRFHPGQCGNSNLKTPRTIQNESLLAQQLHEGGYGLDDRDLSRFLRDSRRLRHGLETEQEFVMRQGVFGQRNIRNTGSSLANMSSDSSSVNREYRADASTSGSHYSELDTLTVTPSRPVRRAIQYLATTDNKTEAHGLQYSSLASAQTSNHGVVTPAVLVCNEAGISVDGRSVQRRAGGILLAFGVLTYLPGGWTLIHSMGTGGPLATTAMAELTRVLEGEEAGVVCCVHPLDAAMARAIERAVVVLVVVGAVGWLAVALWSATTF
ncbi:hypothetical protein H2200_000610 [Cladophialophora chaetospira]|uniref:Uncharacterized protein n=1 Tax=Cladophialophora chaetospira TaxID=386627 RepID=A0AA38XNS6_9EURO|nr:hypothetical protein H2200_000610 [Cladophialophora chaetospira]